MAEDKEITIIPAQAYNEAVHHWMYFMFNFPHQFWIKAFEDGPEWLRDHITDKFNEAYKRYGAVESVPRFFMELDNERRNQLMDWVRENYDGYTMKTEWKKEK